MANTTATGNAAAARVFAVAELLENILIHLPPVDIYMSKMINTTFNGTISGSPKLHEKMHLEHADTEAIETLLFDMRVEDVVHPIELFTMSCLLQRDRDELRRFVENIDQFDIVFTMKIARGDKQEQMSRLEDLASAEKEGSWRKIKIGAPGQKILVQMDCGYWDYLSPEESAVVLSGGITFGELIRSCVENLVNSDWLDGLGN